MIYYASGIYALRTKWKPAQSFIRQALTSYAYERGEVFDKSKYLPHIGIMLDSGAFTVANSRKEKLTNEKYTDYVLRNQQYFECFACMDSLLAKGEEHTDANVRKHADETMENWQFSVSMGVDKERLIYVWHAEEPLEYLRWAVNNCPYVGIGGLVTNKLDVKQILDGILPIVTEKGEAKCKIHLFGITRAECLFGYPWYSADSATWIRAAAMNCFYVPCLLSGKPDFDKDIWNFNIAARSKNTATHHWMNIGDSMRKLVLDYLIGERVISKEEDLTVPLKRMLVNLDYSNKLIDEVNRRSGKVSIPDVFFDEV